MSLVPLLQIVFFLWLFFVFGFIISIWFLFQRKKWQRRIALLCGLDLCILALAGMIPRVGNYYEIENVYKLYLELIGFSWITLMSLLPGKKELAKEITPGLQEKQNPNKVRAAVIICLAQFLFKILAFGYNTDTLFIDKWEIIYSNTNLLMLALFFAGIILFYFRKNAGWLFLLSYFVYAGLSTLLYIIWLIYVQHSQSLYHVELSVFSCIYLAYYSGCLFFLFRKNILLYFSVRKEYMYLTIGLSSLLVFALFYTNYL